MHTKLTLLLFFFQTILFAQTIPADRLVNWSNAGHVGAFIEPNNVVDFMAAGGINDGQTANDDVIQSIISNNINTPTVIYFPEGNYLFNKAVLLQGNIILRGVSPDLTKLSFDLDVEGHAISALGSISVDSSFVAATILKDDRHLTIADSTNFQLEDFVYLIDHDEAKITSSWGLHATGQICQIDSIASDTIYFKNEIRRDYLLSDNPVLIKTNLKENIGIENLTIERLDANTAQTSNINFRYTYNCWIKCIESINCNYSHIEVRNSTNTEIAGCYIHDAFNHGSGGKAYGVMLHFGTGESLIYNNVFERLRHSMIMQAGANGNVFSYNYSFDPYWTSVALPSNSAGDAVLHGNYPYANLFEGNILQNIVIDNSHGINGPHNTFFRNRAELYGLFMNNSPASNGQNYIGNEITNDGSFLGLYILAGSDHFESGNNQNGTFHPIGTQALPEHSLYLDGTPDYFLNQSNWPPLGTPNDLNAYSIEAKDRFDAGQVTPCSPIVSSSVQLTDLNELIIFPNPASDLLFIETGKIVYDEIALTDVLGNEVLNSRSPNLNIAHLEDGIYFVRLMLENEFVVVAAFVKM